jgi:ribulose-5-phosphate 4-epimerase/fuculose-1-phosphate aldolase
VTNAEWQARIDLAAAHRLCVIYDWSHLIFNHISMRVPGEPRSFLLKPHALLFEEVRASNLVKLDMDGGPLDESQNVNKAGFTIHGGLLRAKPELNCVLHVHTNVGMAFSAHKKGLMPMTQGSMRFYNRLSYHAYEGIADDEAECARLAADLGNNRAMVLRNHGLLTAGRTVAEAITLMKYLIAAAETQMMLEATNAEIVIPPPDVCEHTAQQWERWEKTGAKDEWPAYLRQLDMVTTDYRD